MTFWIGLGVFVVFLFVLEAYYASQHKMTISEHVQGLFAVFPAIGFIVGVIVGWLGAHFFGG
jgi:hypothetical protein